MHDERGREIVQQANEKCRSICAAAPHIETTDASLHVWQNHQTSQNLMTTTTNKQQLQQSNNTNSNNLQSAITTKKSGREGANNNNNNKQRREHQQKSTTSNNINTELVAIHRMAHTKCLQQAITLVWIRRFCQIMLPRRVKTTTPTLILMVIGCSCWRWWTRIKWVCQCWVKSEKEKGVTLPQMVLRVHLVCAAEETKLEYYKSRTCMHINERRRNWSTLTRFIMNMKEKNRSNHKTMHKLHVNQKRKKNTN